MYGMNNFVILACGLIFASYTYGFELQNWKTKFVQEYINIRQIRRVALIKFHQPQEQDRFLDKLFIQFLKKLPLFIQLIVPKSQDESDFVFTLHTSHCFHGGSSQPLFIIQIQDKNSVFLLNKLREICGTTFTQILVLCDETLENILHYLILPLNNKFVFSVQNEAKKEILVVDYFQTTENSAVRKNVVGIWTNRTKTDNEDTGYTMITNKSKALKEEHFNSWRIRKNLSGLHLHCSTIADPPFLTLKEASTKKVELVGPFQYLLKHLQTVLNFSYECFRVRGNSYGNYNKKTKTWSGVVGELISNKTDVAVTYLDITVQRSQVINYLTPLRHISRRLFFKKQTRVSEGLQRSRYLEEFSVEVWAVIAALYTIFVVVLVAFSHISYKENKYSISDGFLGVVAIFTKISSDVKFHGTPGRILLLTMLFSVSVLSIHYSSFLVSYLTYEEYKPPFTSLQGLYKSNYKFRLEEGRNSIDFFRTSPVPLYQLIWKEMLEPHRKEFPKSEKELKPLIMDGYVGYSAFPRKIMGNDSCGIYEIPFVKIPESWGIQRNSPFKDILNYHVIRFLEAGLLDQKNRRIIRREEHLSAVKCSKGGDQSQAITFKSVYFLYFLLLGGLFLSILCLFVEIMTMRIQNRLKKNRELPVLKLSKA